MDRKVLERFLEFFLIGLLLGIVEDIIAIKLSTGAPITWKMIGIIALVALPFAAFSELVVDKTDLIVTHNKKKKKR